jgi:hypothetical protein
MNNITISKHVKRIFQFLNGERRQYWAMRETFHLGSQAKRGAAVWPVGGKRSLSLKPGKSERLHSAPLLSTRHPLALPSGWDRFTARVARVRPCFS